MKASHLKHLLFVLVPLLLLNACGGGGDGMMAGGGTGGTGIISNGSITAFGSIFVNGTEFDTSNATITINGQEIGVGDEFVQAYLDIGRVVTVMGTGASNDATGVANQVNYNDSISGPIEGVHDMDAITKEIVVLGQIVIINAITKLKGTTFETLSPNDYVKVSGLPDDTGAIRGTFLEKTGAFIPGDMVEVTGYIINLDGDNQTFEINSLRVHYDQVDPTLLPEGFSDGLWVEVAGSLDEVGGAMMADSIQLGDETGADNSDQIEVLGFVSHIDSAVAFTVGQYRVQYDETTLFVDGNSEDLLLGAKLEAEGSLVDGIILAEEIEFWEPNQVEVEGFVIDVASESTFTLQTTDGDQLVQTDAENTLFEGVTPSEIEVGMKIEVKGVPADIDCSVLLADKVSLELD